MSAKQPMTAKQKRQLQRLAVAVAREEISNALQTVVIDKTTAQHLIDDGIFPDVIFPRTTKILQNLVYDTLNRHCHNGDG